MFVAQWGGRERSGERDSGRWSFFLLKATGSVPGRRACASAVVVGCMRVGVARCLHRARSTSYALVGHCHARTVTCSSTRPISARPHIFSSFCVIMSAHLFVLFLLFLYFSLFGGGCVLGSYTYGSID